MTGIDSEALDKRATAAALSKLLRRVAVMEEEISPRTGGHASGLRWAASIITEALVPGGSWADGEYTAPREDGAPT